MRIEAGGRSVQVSGKLLAAVFVLLFAVGGLAEFVVFQNVTFNTNVPLVVPAVIDGSTANLAKSQSFMVGSTHSVSVPSVLNLTSTTDYAFVKWSDGATQASRQFTVPTGGATLTAMYQRRVLLTVVENATEGTISSSGVALAGKGQTKTAWVVAGANVTLSEAGNPSLKIGNSWHSFIADGWKVNDIRQNTSKSSFSLVMNEPMIVSGVFFDPSASQTATGGLWQEMKPCSYYIFPDTAATPNIYAQDCNTGAIAYGGSGNAGGATGTSGAAVFKSTFSASTGGTVRIADGTYSLDFLTMTGSSMNGVNLIGNSRNGTILKFTGTVSSFASTGNGYALNMNGGSIEHMTIDASGLTISTASGQFGGIQTFGPHTSGGVVTGTGKPYPYISDILAKSWTTSASGVLGLGVNLFNGPYAQVNGLWGIGNDVTLWVTVISPGVNTNYIVNGVTITNSTNRGESIYVEAGSAQLSNIQIQRSTGILVKTNLPLALNTVKIDTNLAGGQAAGILVTPNSPPILGLQMANIYVAKTQGYSMDVEHANGFVLNGFSLSNAGLAGVNKDGLIIFNSLNYTVSNGIVYDNQASHTTRLGVYDATASDTGLITNVNVQSKGLAGSGGVNILTSGSGVYTVANPGFNSVAASDVTAGASVWTYTNNDGYDEVMILKTVNGQTAETCNGVAVVSPTTVGQACDLPPSASMTATWATTAPVYHKVPLFA